MTVTTSDERDSASPRRRLTAAKRHEQVLHAAILAFAESGYAGTTTDDVARRVGVSQPYVIQIFGTKQALFLAAVDSACTRIEETFRVAAEAHAELEALGEAFKGLLSQRELLRVLLHAFAASGDPAVGPVVRRRYGEIYQLVRELTGADADETTQFWSAGMLLMVLSAMDVVAPDGRGREPWADELMSCLTSDHPRNDQPQQSAQD